MGKALAGKSDDLVRAPDPTRWKEKADVYGLSSDPNPYDHGCSHSHIQTHMLTKARKKIFTVSKVICFSDFRPQEDRVPLSGRAPSLL